jgi:molecular chaperone DnaK
MSKVIGIDLGTTNSVVAVIEGSEPRVITNEEGSRTTPSVVAYTKSGDRLVGTPARRQAVTNPRNTIFSAKRFIGSTINEVGDIVKRVPYDVKSGKGGSCVIHTDGKKLSPEQISAQVLIKLKRSAEKHLGHEVKEAVITVPAYFNDSQRQSTKDAGKIAGLDVKRIINEPTAAALAYGMDKKGETKVAVFDLGGGTFDISILEIADGVVEVLSTNGDTHLGGDNVDEILMDWMFDEFNAETGIDLREDKMVIQRIKEAAEKAKIELSSTQQTEVNLPFLTADSSGPKHLILSLTRSKFEQMIEKFVKSTLTPVRRALKDAGLKKGDVDEVLLVGGSTRIPVVKNAVEKFFGKSTNSSVNPDEVVALGAAVQGGIFSGDVNDILLLDVTPLSLGIETLGGIMTKLIDRNTTIPCKKSETFSTAEDSQAAVDIHVLQGEREFSSHNRTLGNFRLDGIAPAPRGLPQIEVTFDIDANGIVSVSAKDKSTGKEQSITITDCSSLSEDDITSMVNDAKEHEEEDRRKKEVIQTRNSLDTMLYNAAKLVDENSDKLSEENLENLSKQISASRDAMDCDDKQILDSALSALSSAVQSAGAEIYSDLQDVEQDVEETVNEDVIDADFSETEMASK